MPPEPPAAAHAPARWRIAFAAAAALLIALAWLAIDSGEGEPIAAAEVASTGPGFARVEPTPPPTVAVAKAAPEPALEPAEIEICGGEWVRLGADGKPDPVDLAAARARLTQAAEAIAFPALAASPDDRARAAAHAFRVGRERLLGAAQPECKDDDACRRRVDAWRAGWQAERDALVRIALVSGDATLYGWAHRACDDAQSRSGDCQLVNAAQWSRLDPGNAAPWLAVAAEASQRGDIAGFDEAMFRVATAARHDSGQGALPALLIAHLPPGEANAVGALELALQASAIESRIEAARMQEVSSTCQAAELADANRRETCSGVANVLTLRSATLLASSTGKALGRRLGWPAERIAALDAEHAAFARLLARDALPDARPTECSAVLGLLERLSETGQVGELQALRARSAPAAASPYFAALPTTR